MNKKLTKEEALKLHRQMWSDMQKELGDNPYYYERIDFKENWCARNNFENISANCFLCEYDRQHPVNPVNPLDNRVCNCPLDWIGLTGEDSCSGHYGSYRTAPISEILALPERVE